MKTKHAAGWAYGLITFSATVATTTLGHYAENWSLGYFVGFIVAAFGGLSVVLMHDD